MSSTDGLLVQHSVRLPFARPVRSGGRQSSEIHEQREKVDGAAADCVASTESERPTGTTPGQSVLPTRRLAVEAERPTRSTAVAFGNLFPVG